MKVVADSFSWPFRGNWKSAWVPGLFAILFLPIAFVPLLGYAIAATRAAETNPKQGPPPWTLSSRLISDGFWTSLAVLVFTAPFLFALNPVAALLFDSHVGRSNDPALSQLFAQVAAALILALPWGYLLLVHMPHAAARFANTRRPLELFNVPASVQAVKNDFTTWNLAAAAIVTGWALGLAAVGILCVGIVPGAFYAILVSAHASAALHSKSKNPPAR
jgi:hypothetical protein